MRNGFGRRARACGFALALGIGSVQITCPVYADTTDDAVARSRPEYDAQGIPLGIFRLFPSVTLATSFDDNIDRRETNTLSDVFFTFSPSAALRSQWSQDALNLSASSDTLVYSRYSSENITNYNFKGYGQLDVLRSFRITSDASFARLHVLRSSPELALNAVSPLPYSQTHVDVSAEYQPSDLDIIVGVDFDHYDYGAVDLVGGGSLSWNDQNRDIILPHARVSYQFSPGYTAYLEGIYDDRRFESALDRSGYDRSSQGYRVRGGLGAPLSHLVQGEIFLGYLDQQFIAPLPNVTGLDFGAKVDWYATRLTTVRLSAARIVNDTTFAAASAMDDETMRISVDHELLRNLILQGFVGYTDSHFRGIVRDDRITDAGFGADYLLNSYFSVAARYTYQSRDSSISGQGFSDNLFSIGITGHL
jgi:hypothetical protein